MWRDPSSIVADQEEESRPLCLWIDAISISQSDAVEKASQIRLMKEIFEKAQHVVCWLGEEGEEFRVAYSKLCQITAWYDKVHAMLGGIGVNKYIMANVA